MLDGTTFKATFSQHSGRSIQLENEQGTKRGFPIDKFSIVDRHYLFKNQGISIEHLTGGNIHNAETKIKFKSSDFKKVENFHFDGELDEKKIKVVHRTKTSPHFIFFYEDSIDIEPHIESMERVWYAHALRTPGFISDWGDTRKVYFYIPYGEKLNEIREYAVNNLPTDTDQHKRNHIWRNWYQEHIKTPVKVRSEFIQKYKTEETGQVMSYDFSDRNVRDELLTSYPFFAWQQLFFPGEKLPQRKVKTESKLASQKGYLCLIYGNEIRLHDNQNLTYSQFYKDGLGIAIPKQGEVKVWAQELAEQVEDENVNHTVSKMIYNDQETLTSLDGDKKIIWAQLLMSFGRFMEKDIAHMIYRCDLINYIDTHDAFPDHERLCEIFHYKDTEELDSAFLEFLVNDNKKLK